VHAHSPPHSLSNKKERRGELREIVKRLIEKVLTGAQFAIAMR